MTTPSDLGSWPTELPEADLAEQQQPAWPGPGPDPEDPLPPGDLPAGTAGAIAAADEADLVEQSRDLPWEDGDEER
jgi:hypothetical protein